MEYCVLEFYFVLEECCQADTHRTAFQTKDGCKNSKIVAVPVMGVGSFNGKHSCIIACY
jgi:hypothetical protein